MRARAATLAAVLARAATLAAVLGLAAGTYPGNFALRFDPSHGDIVRVPHVPRVPRAARAIRGGGARFCLTHNTLIVWEINK